jgi:hypothetical protein
MTLSLDSRQITSTFPGITLGSDGAQDEQRGREEDADPITLGRFAGR